MTYHMMVSQWAYWSGVNHPRSEREDFIWEQSRDIVGHGVESWNRWNNIIAVFNL